MAVATKYDVETALGRTLTSSEETQAEWWLTGLELLIVSRLGPVAALDEAAVKYVEAEAIAAKVRHAAREMSTRRTVSVDDGTVTDSWEAVSDADVADWWHLLSPALSATAYSIPVSSPLDRQ